MNSRGEFDFLARLRERARRRPDAFLSLGIGDDAAVFAPRSGCETLISTDLLVEDIDFRLSWITPAQLGHKALAVSLSDLAAMGARPRYALVALGLSARLWPTNFKEQFYRGFFALADSYQVNLIGGDLSRTPGKAVIDSIVLGEVRRGRSVGRSGARPGDLIFVTGSLGGAAGGLRLLRKNKKVVRSAAQKALIKRQLLPSPRIEWGLLLGGKRLASAMIDLSDGLSSDLAHLCRESGVGARVEAETLPLDPSLTAAAQSDDEAFTLALDGGEDYELLFTVDPRRASKLPRELHGVPLTRIGEITEKAAGLKIRRANRWVRLRAGGFRHF